MSFFHFLIRLLPVLALGLTSCQSTPTLLSPPNKGDTPVKPIWIDTDPAVGEKDRDVDDGLALIQSFHSPEIQIRGISAVFGNTELIKAFPIAQEITRRFGPANLPVFSGASGAKDLGKETEATQALEKALKQEKLTLLALGPVTNIATVIKNHPHLHSQIQEIVAVAGRRPGQRFTTGTQNPKVHRDFNFEMDPEAFQVILNSNIPLTLVPFEISSKVWIQEKDLEKFRNGTKATKWLAGPSQAWLNLWGKTFSVDGFNPFDSLAVAYVTTPELIQCEKLPVEIQTLPDDGTEEKLQGTKDAFKKYLLASNDLSSRKKALYCFEAHPIMKDDLLMRLHRKPRS
jgi:pyrimidine-specific ribonucleoside hydrolase